MDIEIKIKDIRYITTFFYNTLCDLKKRVTERGYNLVIVWMIYNEYVIDIKRNGRPGIGITNKKLLQKSLQINRVEKNL